jgi:hypothetical protein
MAIIVDVRLAGIDATGAIYVASKSELVEDDRRWSAFVLRGPLDPGEHRLRAPIEAFTLDTDL